MEFIRRKHESKCWIYFWWSCAKAWYLSLHRDFVTNFLLIVKYSRFSQSYKCFIDFFDRIQEIWYLREIIFFVKRLVLTIKQTPKCINEITSTSSIPYIFSLSFYPKRNFYFVCILKIRQSFKQMQNTSILPNYLQ